MSDYQCPHCGEGYEACEGPYEEDRPDEIDCDNCGKTFLAYVHYGAVTYSSQCLPDDHDFEVKPYKGWLMADCRNCEEMQFSNHPTLCSPAALKAFSEWRADNE